MPWGRDKPTPTIITCPRCGKSVPPGAERCQHCAARLNDPSAAAFSQRLKRISPRTLVVLSVSAALAILAAFFGVQTYRIMRPGSGAPQASASHSAPRPADIEQARQAEAAGEAFFGDDLDAARAAYADFRQLDATALEELVKQTNAQLSGETLSAAERARVRAALHLLAERADALAPSDVDALIAACEGYRELREGVVLLRAMLGDAAVIEPLSVFWRSAVEQSLHLSVSDAATGPGGLASIAEADERVGRLTAALQRLAEDDVTMALSGVAAGYWSSWSWLGQERGEGYLKALFRAAQPYRARRLGGIATSEADVVASIRHARSTLDALSQTADTLAAAAAGLALLQEAPQYSSARERIEERLLERFADASAAEQQVIAFTLTRIAGRPFAEFDSSDDLRDVDATVVWAVLRWLASRGREVDGRGVRPRYAPPLRLTRRVAPRPSSDPDQLATELASGGEASLMALTAWRASGYGLNARARTWLDDGASPWQTAAALTLVAEEGAVDVWNEVAAIERSAGQPGWVRGLAHMTLGVLDQNLRGRYSEFPQRLDAALLELPDDASQWVLLRQVAAAGGPEMLEALRSSTAPVARAVHRHLLRLARSD